MALSLPRLSSFAAVAQELHFGRAAARVHLTQPALSRQVRELEAQLGLQLLTRTSRSVALTAAGEALLPQALRVLAEADALEALAREHRPGGDRPLVVGFTGSAAGRTLPETLQRLHEREPDVQIALRELTTERYDGLRTGELDIVLGRLRPEEMPDLDVLVLTEEPRVAALWETHPLAGRAEISMGQLREDGFITQPEALNPAYRQAWLAEQRAHGLEGRIVVAEASSLQEILNLVAAGRGVCLGPRAAAEFNPWPGVAYVPLSDAAGLPTSVVSRRGEADPRVRAFRRAARAR